MTEWETESFLSCPLRVECLEQFAFSSLYNQPPACCSETLQAFNRSSTYAEVGLVGVFSRPCRELYKSNPASASGGVRCAADGDIRVSSKLTFSL